MKRLYFYRNGVFFNYRVVGTFFKNKYFKDAEWFILEEWFLRIAIGDCLFGITDMYYDGHTVKGFVFLGIDVALGYTYDSRPVVDWKDELPNRSKA